MTVSIFIPFILLILISTGWLTFLPSQLGVTKQSVIIYLAVIGCSSLLPPISIFSFLDIQLDYLFMILLFIYFLSRTSFSQLVTLLSLVLMLGSILFLFHELSRTSLMWRSSIFQWVTIFLSMCEAIVSTNKMREQFCLIFGGLLVTQSGLNYLYSDRISPIAFPGSGLSDVLWITILILILVKSFQLGIPMIKNWRIAYWIKKR